MMRRFCLAVLVLGALAILPVLAAGKTETASSSQKQVNLQVAWWGSQTRDQRTIEVLKMYEKVHPNVHFTYDFSGYNDYWTKLTTQAAGGNLPDIMQQDQDNAYLAQWETRGLIEKLDPYVKSGVLDLRDVEKSFLNGGYWNGGLYAVNLGANSQSIVVDLDAFRKAGVALPPEQWTWKEFESIVLKLHRSLGIWGMGNVLGSDQWMDLYLGYGKDVFAQNGKGLGYENDTPFVEFLKMALRLEKAGAIPPWSYVVTMRNKGVEREPIVSGKSAMGFIWSNQIVALWSAAGKKRHFKLVLVPRPEGGGHSSNFVQPSQFFSVTSQSKHPETAASFISYFTNSIPANKVLLGERGVPISSKVREALKPLLSEGGKAQMDYLTLVASDGNSSPMPPPFPPAGVNVIQNVLVPLVIDPVMYGKITPEEGVKLLRKKASAILSGQQP
jgi:multiple sugar transport system substrate-binding protein